MQTRHSIARVQCTCSCKYACCNFVTISISSAVGVIIVFLLVGVLLGYIVVVKKILSQIAANSKKTIDMEDLASSVLISNPHHQ